MTKTKGKRPPSSLLGLKLERNKLEGVVVRRSGSGVQIQKTFQAPLTLDPLTNDAELVGREILNQLSAAGIRERRCAVCLPLSWAHTIQVAIPELPEEDIAEYLGLEAEKGFPYSPDELMMGTSRFRTPGGEHFATMVAIPKGHLTLLEKALRAAKLKPVSFSLAVTSVQTADAESGSGLVSLWVGDNTLELQIVSGTGIVALRSLQARSEADAGAKAMDADTLAREIKITLGQLPRSIAQLLTKVRLFGRAEITKSLLKDLRPRLDHMGLATEIGTAQRINGFTLPGGSDEAMSPAFGLAARCILGHPPAFEFLPPKISRFPQLVAQFSSRKIFPIAAVAALLVIAFGGPMGYRAWQEAQLRTKWKQIEKDVTDLTKVQNNIKTYHSWYEDFSVLDMYTNLVASFPANGADATAKSVTVKEPFKITVTGDARNVAQVTALEGKLKQVKRFADINTKRTSQPQAGSRVQFTVEFSWLGRPTVN